MDNFVLIIPIFGTNKYLEIFIFLRGREGLIEVSSVYPRADNDLKEYFPSTWIINRTSLSGGAELVGGENTERYPPHSLSPDSKQLLF